jgi:hypothetical protein
MEPTPQPEKPQTYLGQVFSDKLTLVPLVAFVILVALGVYSATHVDKARDGIGGPLGMGNGPLLIGFGVLCLAVAFLVPLFHSEQRRKRGL